MQLYIGAELTDFVLVLNTKEAVKTFSHFGNITLGGNISSKVFFLTIAFIYTILKKKL